MTDNDFITAARAEAHARSMAYIFSATEPEKPLDWGGGFQEGAVWARDHLAAQEPTDAEVEAAAQVWQAHSRLAHPIEGLEPSCEECGYAFGWPGISAAEEGKRYREHVARAALAAARAVRQEKR